MSRDPSAPKFDAFAAWLARQPDKPVSAGAARRDELLAAARAARDATLGREESGDRVGHLEVLQLLAAADESASARPPELMTARGFRVTLAYEESGEPTTTSICVLVHCPPELVRSVRGETAYLWSGTQRFELGQFDADGKAIGTLPAGIEITLSDFALGKVKLEEPAPSDDE
jgi:hypothetical protein